MKKATVVAVFICMLSVFTPSEASATYLTIENVWGSSINFVNMGFWDVSHTIELGELWSSDYGLRPPGAFPLDITKANPLLPGEKYTTALVPWLPDSGFLFTGLGVGGDFGFTGVSDADPGHTVIIPGSSVINALWPTGGPGIGCDTCGTVDVMRITFHAGAPDNKPPPGVPEPASLLLIGTGLAGLGIFRRSRERKPS